VNKDKVSKILRILAVRCPRALTSRIGNADPFRSVIETALSAQTTDAQVDRISPALFRKYPTSKKLAAAKRSDIEKIIKPVGLYKSKAKNIIAASRMIEEKFGGRVPATRDMLIKLPGVGRKTANVVLIKAFGIAAMPVDTHVFRVANRIGLAKGKTPKEVEEQLLKIIPERHLGSAHFWLIHHGRAVCHARNPECGTCPVAKCCRYLKTTKAG
jgi:endonuclease-3